MVTIFRNIFDKIPHYISVKEALERIRSGKSKDKIEEIRTQIDKDRQNKLKCNLPSVCFSGKFKEGRLDAGLIEHSGFICLDFDEIEDVESKKQELLNSEFCYSVWASPRENGLKMLVKIADPSKHKEHFSALKSFYAGVDSSGGNLSRVCYESFDPNIFVNEKSSVFSKIQKEEKIEIKEKIENQTEIFSKILKWLTNKGDSFVSGERNAFIYKLGAACCRFGIHEENCLKYCQIEFLSNDNTFSESECQRTIKSAYKANGAVFGNAVFEKDKLIDRITKGEVKVEYKNPDIYNLEIRPKDVIFGEDVKDKALNIYENGYESIDSTGIAPLDEYFKFKKGEITLLTGIGNYGKSTLWKYLLLLKTIVYNDKFAFFAPEDNPAEEFYHDFVEIYLGCDCTPRNPNRPSREKYDRTYDLISKKIFYVYPKELAPTPVYIKEKFLELIIKEKISGVVIDPFNQLSNDYGARSDKYLETFLSDCSRFAQLNNVYFTIVAHPRTMHKPKDELNYPCPDVFDVADGAMWNNKMDNILVYHRPNHQSEPDSVVCELHSKKIRRQKTVGKKGVLQFELNRKTRRFFFNGVDYMAEALKENQSNIDFKPLNPSKEFLDKPAYEYGIRTYTGDSPF